MNIFQRTLFVRTLNICLGFLGFVVVSSALLLALTPAYAQVTSNQTVTATVPDNSGPSVPVLISPNNGSYVTDSTPNFTWQASTDANGIGKYVLTLDGSTLFDNIPTTATDNSQYTLTYNGINSQYTLTPKNTIADGAHTWKIRAVDTLGNGTDSATWSFTMDTLSPSFVVTSIGEVSTSISAQDASTIPSSAIILQNNSPLLVANGEANSSVSVSLIIPGDPTQNFSTSVQANGSWSLQLGILPRDVEMTLNITITDTAGNVSVLNGVNFLIQTQVIVIPPASPSPSPSVAPTPSPSPPVVGITSPQPSPSPDSSPLPQPSPIISIPVIPPTELANELVQEVIERLPAAITNLVAALPKEVVKVIQDAAPVSGLLVSAAIPAASAIAIGSQFGGSLSLNMIVRILQSLGLIPSGKPQGLVFNSKTYEPVPFALLTITNPGSKLTPVVETVVTDVFGVYRGLKLPPDMYQITVSHQDYSFPSKENRLSIIPLQDFYLGEQFRVESSEIEQLFLIPIDPLTKTGTSSWRSRLRVKLAQLSKLSGLLLIPLFLLSGFLSLLFPSVWNWIIFSMYTVLVVRKATTWFKTPVIAGIVTDNQGAPIENAVVRVRVSETNQLASVISTDKKGEFKVFGKPHKYQLVVTKPDFIWVDQNAALSFYEVNTTKDPQQIAVVMQPISQIYSNLFS